jgi:hypothetical protein
MNHDRLFFDKDGSSAKQILQDMYVHCANKSIRAAGDSHKRQA